MKKIYLALLLFSLHYSYCQKTNDLYTESSVVKVNQTLPNFSVYNKDGKVLNSNDYKGKIILINFFATWCGPCMKEMPYLENDIWKKLKDNPNFVILSFGREHSQEEINDFVAKKKFSFPIFADKDRAVYSLFAKNYIPRNYLIDKDGTVVFTSTGFSLEDFDLLKEKINSLLK